jgi:pre-mRNA-splicing factor CWC22
MASRGSKRRRAAAEEVEEGELAPEVARAAAADAPAARRPRKEARLSAALTGRAGGVYIPPFKLARMRENAAPLSKDTAAYQRMTWESLRKGINRTVNKINVANITDLVPELFELNLVRGRGLLARAIMKAQLASPGFTHVYAALVAVINTRMPEIGELIVHRVVVSFRRAYKRNDKIVAIGFAKFMAHLVNYQIAHELLALQLLTLLLDTPTDDSVEVAIDFVKQCGQLLAELSPRGLHAVFERFRGILHEGEIDKRVQYTVESLFAVRKGGFAEYATVPSGLDLVDAAEQITHDVSLTAELERHEYLDVFHMDTEFKRNETLWASIRREILGSDGEESSSDDDDSSGSASDGDSESERCARRPFAVAFARRRRPAALPPGSYWCAPDGIFPLLLYAETHPPIFRSPLSLHLPPSLTHTLSYTLSQRLWGRRRRRKRRRRRAEGGDRRPH